jgi:hypothetical protein
MKQKIHGLATMSLVFGIVSFLGLFMRPGPLKFLAFLLGLIAVLTGLLAAWLGRKSDSTRRRALSGTCLGASGALFGFMFFFMLVSRQNGMDRWKQEQGARLQKAMDPGRMPEKPVTNFTSNLPIVLLHTGGKYISKEGQAVVHAQFFDVQKKHAFTGTKPDYDGLLTMHARGSSTLHLPKQSFTFHTVDAQTNQTSVSLLGLPKDEDWVLYAPFEDKTMIRDVLAFQLANKMGRYAPRTRYVELFLSNGSSGISMSDYAGVYVLVEKIKRGPQRVNIAKLKPEYRTEPEISGGYIVKRDHQDRPEGRFNTSHGGPYFFVYPNQQQINAEQKSWIKNYFNKFENALYSEDFKDPQRGYAAYLDVDSFIDAHWLVEMSKNVDGFRYSAFVSKDRGGKLKPEPPWDYNRAFGNANYYGGGDPRGWYWSRLRPNEISWFLRLKEDPAFMQRCAARWFELRQSVFDPKKISAEIDGIVAELQEAQERNFKRWPVQGMQLGCNHYVGDSFEDEVRWLKKWIEDRVAWIDNQVGTPATL